MIRNRHAVHWPSFQFSLGPFSEMEYGGTVVSRQKSFIIVDIERRADQPGTTGFPDPSGVVNDQSEQALMPPPIMKPVQAAVPAPDPDLVKKLFQRMGENGSQRENLTARQNSGQERKKNENVNCQTDSGSSFLTGKNSSETVLPKIKPVPADLIPLKTYKAIVANKKLKEKVGTIGGITSGQDPIECGSFYNNSS